MPTGRFTRFGARVETPWGRNGFTFHHRPTAQKTGCRGPAFPQPERVLSTLSRRSWRATLATFALLGWINATLRIGTLTIGVPATAARLGARRFGSQGTCRAIATLDRKVSVFLSAIISSSQSTITATLTSCGAKG